MQKVIEVLSSDNFWWGAIVGATVLGWLAMWALGSYKTTLRLKAESPHQTPEKLGAKFYYLVEESQYNRLLSVERTFREELQRWADENGQRPGRQLDAAGVPKLTSTLLERSAIEVLNNIKAWSDYREPNALSADLQMQIDVVLTMAAQRRVGVQ